MYKAHSQWQKTLRIRGFVVHDYTVEYYYSYTLWPTCTPPLRNLRFPLHITQLHTKFGRQFFLIDKFFHKYCHRTDIYEELGAVYLASKRFQPF